MGQKVNPHGLRVGVIKDWDSRWFANKKDFGATLVEDYNLRKTLKAQLYNFGISKIEIERDGKKVKIMSPATLAPPPISCVASFSTPEPPPIRRVSSLSSMLPSPLRIQLSSKPKRLPYSRPSTAGASPSHVVRQASRPRSTASRSM